MKQLQSILLVVLHRFGYSKKSVRFNIEFTHKEAYFDKGFKLSDVEKINSVCASNDKKSYNSYNVHIVYI